MGNYSKGRANGEPLSDGQKKFYKTLAEYAIAKGKPMFSIMIDGKKKRYHVYKGCTHFLDFFPIKCLVEAGFLSIEKNLPVITIAQVSKFAKEKPTEKAASSCKKSELDEF